MDFSETSTPGTSNHPLRRRKKRTPTNAGPGSSLSGLNRSSLRVVELMRATQGYGFTISGQKPCLLRCIVENSPAERVGLRPGNCLVGVNGQDVSHLAHDDVVRLIGTCTGLLRLHISDSYFSESSDDDTFQVHHHRPKYPHRPRSLSKNSLSSKTATSDNHFETIKPLKNSTDPPRCSSSPTISSNNNNPNPISVRLNSLPSNDHNWESLISSRTPRGIRPSSSQQYSYAVNQINPVPLPPRRNIDSFSSNIDIVRVFPDNNNEVYSEHSSNNFHTAPSSIACSIKSSSGSSTKTDKMSSLRRSSLSIGNTENSELSTSTNQDSSLLYQYQAVVGYVGSVDLPEIEEKRRLQALSACVRRLRLEKRVRSIVLLRVKPNGISLFSSSQNVQRPPLAFYSSNIISFAGAYSDDRRFFGLVTKVSSCKNCSCHVFMVEPKLLSHTEHMRRARAFGIQCNLLSVPKNGQVLGLQECVEFPATADPILSSILRLYRPTEEKQQLSSSIISAQRSPSEASNRLESTNSSNSDSGIGFRDESDRTSARIYDIIDTDLSGFEPKQFRTKSPVLRKRLPVSHRKSNSLNTSSNNSTSHLNHFTTNSTDNLYHQQSSLRSKENIHFNSCIKQSQHQHQHHQHHHHQTNLHSNMEEEIFQSDPNSLKEILQKETPGCSRTSMSTKNNSPKKENIIFKGTQQVQQQEKSKSYNSLQKTTPHHIEVSVVVTPPRALREKRTSMEQMTPISPTGNHCLILSNSSTQLNSPLRVSSRIGTRSLENLCSPEIITQTNLESSKGVIGLSTPALNQESSKGQSGNEFWKFKVPEPPKQKMELNRVGKWAESIERLLEDQCGLSVFTEFLEREFSAENIHFYTSCLRFKEIYPELTQSQRISTASTIFQRYLQNGASDPVNVDFQARSHVEKALSLPTREMFDLPLTQIFNLLKFDCYPRFLRSDLYRDYASGVSQFTNNALLDPSDSSDQESSVKSQKINTDGRRRSLLPWNLKNRTKNKPRGSKHEIEGLNSLSFIQQNFESGSDHEESQRRLSCKLCRVLLPDNSTTVLQCKPGETLCTVVQRILEKREFHCSAFEVLSVPNNKTLDLNMEVSEMDAREIKVEPRAFIGIELPLGWRVGVRANPNRKISEVLKPILSQHSIKLDSIVVYDVDTDEIVDVKSSTMCTVDGHNLHVKLKDQKLEEITNHMKDLDNFEHEEYLDDDQCSTKTSSSQSSSVFRGFLRRSSKKKRKGKSHHPGDDEVLNTVPAAVERKQSNILSLPSSTKNLSKNKASDEENTLDEYSNTAKKDIILEKKVDAGGGGGDSDVLPSPLSVIPKELNLQENSRNRKPIYITQTVKAEGEKNDGVVTEKTTTTAGAKAKFFVDTTN